MSTSIVITVADPTTEKNRKRSVTNINPDATNDELKAFAEKMIQLTTSSYIGTDRVDKINVDTEEDDKKRYRNITLENVSQNQNVYMEINVDKNQSVNPLVIYNTGGSLNQITPTKNGYVDDTTADRAKFNFNLPNSSGTLFIGISESDTFYSTFIRENVQ